MDMSTYCFTDEQVRELRLNPYVRKVSNKSITYTDEFRVFFVREYENGLLPKQILRKAGFDPKVLGDKRIKALTFRFKKMVTRPEGAEDARKKNGQNCRATKNLTPQEEIQRLKHKIKYLEQENDFLKKIRFLDRKAQSAQNQKKSTRSSSK